MSLSTRLYSLIIDHSQLISFYRRNSHHFKQTSDVSHCSAAHKLSTAILNGQETLVMP